MYRRQELLEKLKEAAASVLPISLIVLAICFVLVPVDTGLMLSFVLATALLILGMGLFTLGAEMSMSKIGTVIGPVVTPPESNATARMPWSDKNAARNTSA